MTMTSTIRQSRRGSLEQEGEMLPTSPPPAIVRWIAWLLIVMFFAGVVAAFVVQMPETVRCPFVLVPKDGADPIQAPYQAVVNMVRVAEAQEVSKGSELFVLRSDEVRMRHTEFQTLTEDLRARDESSQKLEAAYTALINIKDAEIAQVARELKFREKHTETSRDLTVRLEKLAKSGGISQIELTRQQLALAESEKDLNISEKNVETSKLERLKIETERARQRGDEVADMHKLKLRIEALKRDLENAREDLLSIRAPYDAVVLSLAQRNTGNVVQAGAELCQLARIDAAPMARLLIPEQGLPRLFAGQRVRLFFAAFPYQRYGTIRGELGWISPAAVAHESGRHFVASAALDETFLRVKGDPRPLRVGMNGEARVIVGSRRLIEYAFEPVRQLRENMRR
jgi:HlyD family secretion protein